MAIIKKLRQWKFLSENFRKFRYATWLGWQMESNWTNPYLFAVYSMIKPIAGALILVFMYFVVTGSRGGGEFFTFMFVGNAFYMYVVQVLFGVGWVIDEDREHYQVLKYVYITPGNIYSYLFGRGISKIIVTSFAVLITLGFGVFLLDIELDLSAINYPMLFIALFVGLIGIAALGVILAGIQLLRAHHSGFIGESVAGIFFLFSGVWFPITILPSFGEKFAKILPLTYWLEGVRRAVLGNAISLNTGLGGFSDSQIIIILVFSTIIFLIFSIAIYRIGDHIARKKGLIDMTTAY